MINKNDLEELRRLATNTYDNDKRFAHRIIHEVTNMENEIRKLKEEIERLKKSNVT